jgi:tetratricopeptide (TPR) repeat protein
MTKTRWGMGLLLGLTWPGLAGAQAPAPDPVDACATPSPADTEEAKNAYRDGQVAFSEGDYERAAGLWESAYRRDCSAHALLLNLATAYELLGRPEYATAALRRFNERAPGSPYAAANEQRIARLQRFVVAPRPRRDATKPCPTSPSAPAAPAPSSGVSIPVALAVGGAVTAVVGGALYAQARHAAGEAEDRCGGPPDQCQDEAALVDGERARSRAVTSGWITSIGLATLAGGVVWHLLTGPAAPARSGGISRPVRLGSAVSPSGVHLWVGGGF